MEDIVINQAPGKTFIEVLNQIRCKISLNDSGTDKALRKKLAGELGPGTTRNAQLGEAIHSILGFVYWGPG